MSITGTLPSHRYPLNVEWIRGLTIFTMNIQVNHPEEVAFDHD